MTRPTKKASFSFDDIESVQTAQQDTLLKQQNVVGCGVAHRWTNGQETEEPCLSVFVSQKLDLDAVDKADRVPSTISGVKTDVFETGVLFAGGGGEFSTSEAPATSPSAGVGVQVLTGRVRPAEGGYSVGHPRVTAGTIATCVYDMQPFPGIPRRYYILSNNHVLANSNNAQIGDPILQPGTYDGGSLPGDVIAHLSRFIPINFNPGSVNYVDAALAEGPFHQLDREIYWIGYARGMRRAAIGDVVQKTGRTTNYTTGRVVSQNATVNVNYGGGRVARFVRQIMTTNMSAGGDSGSLVLDMNERAVGLLFAGSSQVTIVNNIHYVARLLRVRLA